MLEYYAIVDEKESNLVRFDIFPCEDINKGISNMRSFILEVPQKLKVRSGSYYKITIGDGDGMHAKIYPAPTYDNGTDVIIISIQKLDTTEKNKLMDLIHF
jgi:hypothetical protein